MALKLELQTYQTLANDDEVCIRSLSNILLGIIGRFGIFSKICVEEKFVFILVYYIVSQDFQNKQTLLGTGIEI